MNRLPSIAKLFVIILTSLFSVSNASAQEMLGIANSNYAGVTGVALNPSSMSDSYLNWDVNIIGADIFAQNNYAYIAKSKVTNGDLYSGNIKFRDYYTPNPTKSAYVNLVANLPSVMFGYKRHSFAVTTAYRTNLSVDDVPYYVAKFAFADEHLGYTPQNNIRYNSTPFNIAELSWTQIGLSYSYALYRKKRNYFAVGGTVKLLLANAGGYLSVDKLDFMVPDKTRLTVYDASLQYGHSASGSDALFPGKGVGYDIGFTYEKKQKYGEFVPYSKKTKLERYDYKISASIIDIGYIFFNQNARVSGVNTSTVWNRIDTAKFKTFDNLDNQIGTQFYNNATGSFVNNKFAIGLPTAANVSFDYNINNKFYINGTFIQPIVAPRPSITRPTQIGVVPRYETKYFEVALPYTIYNYTDHRLGLAFRIGTVILGSDKLGQLFGLNDINGADFYFAIKIAAFKEKPNNGPIPCFYKKVFKKFSLKKGPSRTPVFRF